MINNMPAGNEWHLRDTDDKSVNYGKKFKFSFEQFKMEKVRMLIKSYVWQNIQTGTVALSTISSNFYGFKKFDLFASQNGIESLVELDSNDMDNFMTYLRLYKAQNGKPLRYSTQKSNFKALRVILHWGQIFTPELVPPREVFVGNEYPGCDTVHKIEYIPDDVWKQINEALLIEENVYVKYGFIILLSTGMRLSELLHLEVGCVTPHLLNGDTLTRYDFKNRCQYRKMPINPMCADAIAKLTDITAEIREKADEHIRKYLFLYEVKLGTYAGQIKVLNRFAFTSWVNGYITTNDIYSPGFMDRHNITGSNGEIYKVRAHQFRKTVATDMFSKNVDLKVIQEFLCHATPDTTKKYYADDKDIDRAMIFEKVGVIGNINCVDTSVIADENELVWFMENKDKSAKMCDGYCTMPIVDGKICEKLTNHQKCYTCSRYITTPEYLQAHKEHLAELEVQLANNIYGAHYAAHLTPTITILKDIIERLEDIEYES